MSETTEWSDLTTRAISAVSLLLMAAGAALFGRIGLALFTAAVCGCMAWELMRLFAPRHAAFPYVAGIAAFALTMGLGFMVVGLGVLPGVLIGLAVVAGLSLCAGRGQGIFGLYLLAILISGQVVVFLFQPPLLHLLVLLIGVVIATDVFGYLVGRAIGGPKVWPPLSPNKTWSGVIGGWVAAALCGVGLAMYTGNAVLLVPLAIAMAVAAQLGDLAESAVKRRAGVKDASNLIPGHGGFLDRFDGTTGAGLVVFGMLLWDVLL